MTLIWLTLAFVAGVMFEFKFGPWLLKKVGLKGTMRTDLIKNLDTDTLVLLRRGVKEELERRIKITEAA